MTEIQLNDLQKQVLKKYIETDKNLLIVSPTGSGKTFIAEVLALDAPGRVIYAEPLKAIVYQVVDDVRTKVAPLLDAYPSVLPLLTEAYEDDPDDIDHKIIVSTYEKADSIVRRPYAFLKNAKLLVLDEIHNVSDNERGKAVENLVVWAKDESVRIVAMSATVPFVNKIAEWLDAEVIKSDYRPIPLYKYVRVGNTLYGNSDSITFKGDIIRKLVRNGKVVMIFSNTRKKAEALYYLFRKVYQDKVTYLHAGLDPAIRQSIIDGTLKGKYNIVISTTALGQGINLPFHTVIFDDIRLPIIEQGRFSGWRELTTIEFEQICGRAGRPGFDEEGMCIVDAQDEREAKKYLKKYIVGEEQGLVLSHNIYDLIIAILTRLEWAREDDLLRNVSYSLSFGDVTKRRLDDALMEMEKYKIIGWDGNGWYITKYGRAVGYSYLDIQSAGHYIKGLDGNHNYRELILTSPKVVEASKGEDVKWVIDAWISGMDESDIIKHSQRLGFSDLNRLISTVAWQSFGLYRIFDALDMKKEARKVMSYHLQVANGVPLEGLSLIQIPGIGRKRTMELLNMGIKNKNDICLNVQVSVKVLGEKAVRILCQ